MSRAFQLQRLDQFPPRRRRKMLLSGLVMTTLSAFLFWVGTYGTFWAGTGGIATGVVLLVVGGIGVLFFGPLTVYVISELLRIRRTLVPNRRR